MLNFITSFFIVVKWVLKKKKIFLQVFLFENISVFQTRRLCYFFLTFKLKAALSSPLPLGN